MKQRNVFLALAGAALLTSLGSIEGLAQYSNGQWRLPTRATGRQAAAPRRVEPRAEQPVVVVVPSQGGSLLNPVYRVPILVVPAVLLLDGGVFANFGFGFEPIVRLCATTVKMGAVVASNGVVLDPAPASNYTRPVTSQITRSQLLLSGLPVHDVIVSDFGQLACFNRDTDLVYVYR